MARHRRGDRQDQGHDRRRASCGPGDRLPKEADLAERLGLSRNSLREAVKALSLIRVLDVRQGDGTYVTSLEPDLLLDALSFVVDFHRDDTVLQFLEVRRILEPAATAMAAERMTDEDIAQAAGGARRARRRPDDRGAGRQRPRVPPADRGRLGQHRALLADRQPVRPDHPGPDLARPDPGGRRRQDPRAAPGDPRARSPPASPSWPAPGPPCTSPASRSGCGGPSSWMRIFS